MKPSERLTELQNEFLSRWRVMAGPEEFERNRAQVETGCAIAAIEQYLDEHHGRAEELARRRAQVIEVLEMNGPGCDVEVANALLERAGLEWRMYAGCSFERASRKIIESARKAGLF